MTRPATQIEDLTAAYWMELETVINYLAASTNLEGVRGKQVADVLRSEVDEELGHARRLAQRLNELGGVVPGSLEFNAAPASMQPPADQTDVARVIQGVLDAEEKAIEQYRLIIGAAEGIDPVTHDLGVALLADEEAHRRLFQGFAREYELDRA
jgi:bacterioferritin